MGRERGRGEKTCREGREERKICVGKEGKGRIVTQGVEGVGLGGGGGFHGKMFTNRYSQGRRRI